MYAITRWIAAEDAHDLRLVHEVKNMILSAEMRLRSALFRTESRGNHYREDYPNRDDENWLCWTKLRNENGKMVLEVVVFGHCRSLFVEAGHIVKQFIIY